MAYNFALCYVKFLRYITTFCYHFIQKNFLVRIYIRICLQYNILDIHHLIKFTHVHEHLFIVYSVNKFDQWIEAIQ